ARDVHLMRNENEFRSTGDSFFESRGDLVQILRWDRNLHHLQHETFAPLALSQGGQHARVILRRREYLVARFEVHSHQDDLERLGCVARNRDLFAVAIKHLSQTGTNSFRLRLEQLPHRVSGRIFLLPDITNERFGDDAWARRDTAIVEIHNTTRDRERILNDGPVIFIHRDLLRRQVRNTSRRRFDFFEKRSKRWDGERRKPKTLAGQRKKITTILVQIRHVCRPPL